MEPLDQTLDSLPPRPTPKPRSTWKMVLLGLLVLMIYGGVRCGSALLGGFKEAQGAVETFNHAVESGNSAEIWKAADPRFRAHVTEYQLKVMLDRVNARLGKAQSLKGTGLHIKTDGDGTFVEAVFDTQYDKGQAEENFQFIRAGGDLKLLQFNIRSPLLD